MSSTLTLHMPMQNSLWIKKKQNKTYCIILKWLVWSENSCMSHWNLHLPKLSLSWQRFYYIFIKHSTYSMDRRCNINMDPDTRPIKSQMGTNKEAGAGALGILPVLSKEKGCECLQSQNKKVHHLQRKEKYIISYKINKFEILTFHPVG